MEIGMRAYYTGDGKGCVEYTS